MNQIRDFHVLYNGILYITFNVKNAEILITLKIQSSINFLVHEVA